MSIGMSDGNVVETIDGLLATARGLEDRAARIQGDKTCNGSPEDIRELRDDYQNWYAEALVVLPDDLKEPFQKEYESRAITSKINRFITDPCKASDAHALMAAKGTINNIYPYWQYPFASCFKGPFGEQQAILRQARSRMASFASPSVRQPTIGTEDSDLRYAIALACKDWYTIRVIDRLFIDAGCHENWWTMPQRGDSSERMNRVYGWFEGIQTHAPSRFIDIGRTVARHIIADAYVDGARRTAIREILEEDSESRRPRIAIDRFNFHPRVRRAAERLFEDGHYRQAILQTYLALVQEVKSKAEKPDLDNSPLMQSVFSKDNPVLRVSTDKDEQLGFMWLFTGAVMGIRNPRAHSPEGPDDTDVDQALEWLAFASALFRILDRAEKV